MKRTLLILVLGFVGLLGLVAQVDKKYLEGAVPLVDGKVVFTRDVKLAFKQPKLTLYEVAEEWVRQNFSKENITDQNLNRRILVENPKDFYIACQGDDYLVFKAGALSIDRAKMRYQFIIKVTDEGYCVDVKSIRYEYEDFKDGPVLAENMITDEVALSSDKTELKRQNDKFRIGTIDFIDDLVADFSMFVSSKLVPSLPQVKNDVKLETKVAENMQKKTVDNALVIGSDMMNGYKKLSNDELSNDLMGMLKDSWALVLSSNNSGIKAMPANWAGMGSFGSKDVSMVMVDGGDLEKDTYTILFFSPTRKADLNKFINGDQATLTSIVTPSGLPALSEAWLIIESKKVLEQPTTEAILEGTQSKKWDNTNYDKLFMGEIIDIWAR